MKQLAPKIYYSLLSVRLLEHQQPQQEPKQLGTIIDQLLDDDTEDKMQHNSMVFLYLYKNRFCVSFERHA